MADDLTPATGGGDEPTLIEQFEAEHPEAMAKARAEQDLSRPQRVRTPAAQRYRSVRVWTPRWYERGDDPLIPCGRVEHHADVWFLDCEHTPTSWDFTESARALCDETGADQDVLEAISTVYVTAWELNKTRHVESWPLALIVLAGLREAGFEVVRRAD